MNDLLIPSPEGSTRLYVILGDPVAQVMAPVLMNQVFRNCQKDAVMVPMHVHPAELVEVVRGLKRIANLDGMLITVPHKFAVAALVDHVSLAVELAGSANALRREPDGTWSAENFDGHGFLEGLRQAGHEPAGKRIVLIGAGGAGAAIAAALAGCSVAELVIMDVLVDKATRLADGLNATHACTVHAGNVGDWSQFDIAINATPLGLCADDPMPFDVHRLNPRCVVADIIMKPHETRLVLASAARGLHVHHGIRMLTPQIEMYREFFRIA
ncbi:MAG: aroE 1 [Polaromonas sp.]|nr:aroE 1 [Polaromonas sp.]